MRRGKYIAFSAPGYEVIEERDVIVAAHNIQF